MKITFIVAYPGCKTVHIVNLPKPKPPKLVALVLVLNFLGSLNLELTTPVFQFKSRPAQNSVVAMVKKLVDRK
jgi:hypothetical protein